MEIEGRIIHDLGIQSGTSKAGNPWKKREMVLETFGNYPKKVKFTIFGEQKVESMNLTPGKDYVLSVDVESREFQGRWYTDVNVYAARERVAEAQQVQQAGPSFSQPSYGAQQSQPFGQPAAPSQFVPTEEGPDDLPF